MKFTINHWLGWYVGSGVVGGDVPFDNFMSSVRYSLAKRGLRILQTAHRNGKMQIYVTDV